MRKRNLSEFMCIEMLYDYKSEKLDALRSQAVEEGLQSSPKVRQELKKLDLGISYCEKLKNISISEPLEEFILDQPKAKDKVISKLKWHRLPQPVRWAFEAVLVAVAVALFVTQVPNLFKSEKFESDSMLVKKFDIKPPEDLAEQAPVSEESKAAYKAPEAVPMDLQPVDGTKLPAAEAKPLPVAAPEIVATKEIPELLKPPVVVQAPPAVVETPVPGPKTPAGAEAPIATALAEAPVVNAVAPPEEKKATPKKGNAYVYRMTMYVDDVDTVTPEIVALITSLGGERAGEVELGWRRKSGSYFHFSIPQANSEAVQQGLKKYATFNMVKSAHPRVMPEGVERYILWLEKKPTAQEEQDTQQNSSGEETQGTSQENNEAN
jgi:hypothetical protein